MFALLAVALITPSASSRADDDGLGSGDLGAGAELDEGVNEQIDLLLKKARRLLDRRKYAQARAKLEEADDLAPMDDRVLDLLDIVGQLESEEEGARKLLKEIEAEEAEKAKAERAAGQGLKAVLARHHLPRALPRATARLAKKVKATESRLDALTRVRDRCLAGATLSHAAVGAKKCRPLEDKLSRARKELKALEADLYALDEAFARKRGKKALARLQKKQDR